MSRSFAADATRRLLENAAAKWVGQFGRLDAVQKAIAEGADPNAEDEDGNDVLAMLVLSDPSAKLSRDAAQSLVAAGMTFKVNTVRIVMERGHRDLAQWMAENAPVECIPNDIVHDLLCNRFGHEILPILATRKPTILDNKTHEEGNTPMHVAAAKGQGDMLWALIDAGADPDILTDGGLSVLDLCPAHGQGVLANKLSSRARKVLNQETPSTPIAPRGPRL